jgi:hypothetical protein
VHLGRAWAADPAVHLISARAAALRNPERGGAEDNGIPTLSLVPRRASERTVAKGPRRVTTGSADGAGRSRDKEKTKQNAIMLEKIIGSGRRSSVLGRKERPAWVGRGRLKSPREEDWAPQSPIVGGTSAPTTRRRGYRHISLFDILYHTMCCISTEVPVWNMMLPWHRVLTSSMSIFQTLFEHVLVALTVSTFCACHVLSSDRSDRLASP